MDNNTLFKRFKRRLLNIVLLTIKKAADPAFAGSAAELAFFLMLSLTPSLIILAQVLGFFSKALDTIVNIMGEYVSEDVAKVIGGFLSNETSVSVSLGLIILALWSASKAQFSLSRITNYAFTGKSYKYGFIRERLRAMLTILIILVTLLLALAFLVYGKTIVEIIIMYMSEILGVEARFDNIWYFIRWPIALAVYLLTVTSIYFVLPSKIVHIKKILPGSIFSAVGMWVATWIFSYYMSVFSNLNLIYGSLTSIVALLLWFYILSFVIILGIQVNSVWDESGQSFEVPED